MDFAHERDLHSGFFQIASQYGWSRWAEKLLPGLHWIESTRRNSDRDIWEQTLTLLGDLRPSILDLNLDCIRIGAACDLTPDSRLQESLMLLSPWRKGPFCFFDLPVDTEWRSDWKWQRVFPQISDLTGRKILDVGCGSGYHCLRMLGAGADMVLGIDPSQLFWTQFRLMKLWLEQAVDQDYPTYAPKYNVHYLPLPLERFPKHTQAFDTVFSMGVLYHRKSPFEHLEELRGCLRKGGELVLETLVVDGDENTVFVPPDRYASMNNVWCLPSVDALCKWMRKVGFENVRLVDLNQTTIEEQRATEWMRFQSLSDFLDPIDASKTIEGHPAPKRATILGNRV